MRRIAIALMFVALVAAFGACSSDAPAPTPPNPAPTPGTGPLQVRLFTGNANPPAGTCSLLQAIVTLNGVNVPDGTGVAFSTDFGLFSQNNLPLVSVTTQAGAATTSLCSSFTGLGNVHATASVGSNSGSGTIAISFQPSSLPGPFFSFCNPSFGPPAGGTALTISGGRFFGTPATTRVTFTAAGVTREGLVTAVDLTNSTVTVRTPAFPEATSSSVPVTITLLFGTNSSSPITLTIPNCFAYGTAPATQPTITAVLPSSGSNEGNTRVVIVGSGFSAPLQVFFGPVEAEVISITFNQIVVLTPPASGAGRPNLNATVTVRVHLVNSGLDGSLAAAFRFVPPAQITAIANSQQRVDQPFTPVTIFGQGFEAPVAVTLAGIPAVVISVSATEILALPGNPQVSGCTDVSGAVSVTNINTGDTATGANFRYLVAQTAPLITSVSPGFGTPGTIVTITGSGFSKVTSVKFGSRAASFSISSPSTIVATAPDPGTAPPACPSGTSAGTPVNAGSVDITLTTASTGCSGTAAGAFLNQLPCTTAPADLALTKTATPTSVPAGTGGTVTFTLAISNTGGSSAAGVTATDTLPAGATFVSCSALGGTCSFAAGTVTASLGTIAGGGSATVSIVVTISSGAASSTVVNTATVSTTSPEPNLSNNTGTATVTRTP